MNNFRNMSIGDTLRGWFGLGREAAAADREGWAPGQGPQGPLGTAERYGAIAEVSGEFATANNRGEILIQDGGGPMRKVRGHKAGQMVPISELHLAEGERIVGKR